MEVACDARPAHHGTQVDHCSARHLARLSHVLPRSARGGRLHHPNVRLSCKRLANPSDPVLANAIVKGRYAEKYVAEHIRDIISAEAGLNDGLGYPFLFLAVYSLKEPSRAAVVADWFVHIWFYEIMLSIAYGITVGLIARYMLKYALARKWVDNEAFFSFFVALSLFVIGTCGMLGTDDLLAAFAAGNAFSLHDFYRDQTADDTLQTSLDMLLNLATFVWIGATMPWAEISHLDPGWRMIVMAMAILAFGRIPPVLALYKFIPQIKTFKEAGFVAYFGPVGVGAIFYVQIAIKYFEKDPTYEVLSAHLKPIVYSMAFGCICVYGITLPVVQLSSRLQPHFVSLSRSISRRYTTDSKVDPIARLPTWKEPTDSADDLEAAGPSAVHMASTAHDATVDVPPTHTIHPHHEHDATVETRPSRTIQFL
ncbi:Sodium/hydrogen exchanger family-domain-containing protein [Protomyces lactucae-debilis]|uniref:Sodium/hydrogen exchanger family-domain-containing protein n=1 Tax=Protomyces lactucae-debilis TaxID=2754530 RepID=A0A1Y2FJR0_PROLT|nr:Sodium/hydrogen exchanger family-domain-containing protein [Protomyces lactucae-debilis]ORY84201.1 Sodium/hydrogen exchanger family-domain-containing protein [Protomyces lactucae-debilis]